MQVNRFKTALLALLLGSFPALAGATEPLDPLDHRVPIDIAITLDTSGSMRGLIDASRLKLWEIVNELAAAEPEPRLRVALITYGNQRNGAAAGWVKVETDLTEDLDLVSERLFGLQSLGADEYVGRALKTALEELSWSPAHDAVKLLFLAGNESPDQDPEIDFREVSLAGAERGILVSAVFCGKETAPNAEGWRELAELAAGQFATIDHRGRAVVIRSPYDRELAQLSDLLSQTYVPFGEEGAARKKSQLRQDSNARKLGAAVAAGRALTKSGRLYAPPWDLASAYESGRADLYEMDAAGLPPAMRRMSVAERVGHLGEMMNARETLRQRIEELGKARQRFAREQMTRRGIDDSWAFDSVLRRTIRERAESSGFRFPEH